MRSAKKNTKQNPLPFLAFLGILLFSFIVFVIQTQQTQTYVSRAAGGPYPTTSPCRFPCAAPACSDGFKGPSFCGDGGSAGCNVQQDEWCRNNGHGGQRPCYELGTCNTGGGSGQPETTGTQGAAPTGSPGTTVTPTPPITGISNPPAWFNRLPTNLRNYLELLYLWVVVYRRPTNMPHLLEGLIPTGTTVPESTTTPVLPTDSAPTQQTPTIQPVDGADCTQRYSVVDGACVPDDTSTMCLNVCQLLLPFPGIGQ